MKKSIMLAAVAVIIGLFAGCSSISENCNLTGTWQYTFNENGKDATQTGSMALTQDSYNLTGVANDSFGQFNLTGTNIAGSSNLIIDGVRLDGSRTFHIIGILDNDNEFEGTYTTNQNTSGTIQANRIGGN